jgi:hypothetical protein
VERQYVWKLHVEADLGVPLAVSAMDWEGLSIASRPWPKHRKNVPKMSIGPLPILKLVTPKTKSLKRDLVWPIPVMLLESRALTADDDNNDDDPKKKRVQYVGLFEGQSAEIKMR